MAKIPGTGIISGIGLIGKCVYDETKFQNINSIVGDKDPRQEIIQEVINDAYSYMDLVAAGREIELGMTSDIYHALVRKWCNEFAIRYNPYRTFHHAKHSGPGESGVDKSDEAIKIRIKAEIAAYDEAEESAKKNHNTQPLTKKIDRGMLIGMCIATFGGIAASIKLFEVAPIIPVFFWFGIIFGWVQLVKQTEYKRK